METINNLYDLIGDLTGHPKQPPSVLASTYEFKCFRGHSDIEFKLVPSIYREEKRYYLKEDIFFKEIIIRCPNEFQNLKSTFDKLVKMQHYGIPTRLLDITTNPLTALYFACNDDKNYDKTGELICFVIPKENVKYYDSDTVSILSNISRRTIEFAYENDKREEFNKQGEIQYLLHEIKEEKPYFQNIIEPEHLNQVYVVKAKYDNLRILKQEGVFLLFGVDKQKSNVSQINADWIEKKYKIPADSKKVILEDLENIGIDEGTLFPELENQATNLKLKIEAEKL